MAWRRPWRCWMGLVVAVVVPTMVVLRWPRPPAGDPSRYAIGRWVVLRGQLAQAPRPLASGGCLALLQLDPPRAGRTQLLLDRCEGLAAGWRLMVEGRLRRPPRQVHPLLGDGGARLAREGVFSQLRVQRLQVLQRRQGPLAAVRQHIVQRFVAVAGPQRGPFLAALVLGNGVVTLPEGLSQPFRVAGLSHALAASGFQLTVLLGLVTAALRRWPPALQLLGAGLAVLLFVGLAGPQPAVLRAALMGSLTLVIEACGERSRPLGVLLLCLALLLLWMPQWLLDLGFQLSAAATAGLLLTAPGLQRGLQRRLPAWLAAAVAVPLAASLWTLPLQLQAFGAVPLLAVPANLLAAPLLSVLTLGALAAAVLALLPGPLLTLWLALLQWPVQLLLALVTVVAAVPGALLPTGRLAVPLTLLLTAGLLPWLVAVPQARRWRRRGLPLLLLAGLGQGLQQGRDQLLLVHQAGSSLLIARHRGRGALVSSGDDGFSCRRAARLRDGLGIVRFDWVVLFAADTDGAGAGCWQALAPLVQRLPVGRISSPGLSYSTLDDTGRSAWLQLGSQRWLLLPDPVDAALLPALPSGAWRGLWLGRPAGRHEQGAVQALAAGRPLLVSGPGPGAQTVD
jgi:competence protein ComEC